MKDLEIELNNSPGTLAKMGKVLGENKISLEGGGVFGHGATSIAHFLVEEADAAKTALEQNGIHVVRINEVLIQKLRQDVPGQLGMFCDRLAQENVNILVQYSDHANQLIVVVDDHDKGKIISDAWMNEWW